jgi:hypothetical protein
MVISLYLLGNKGQKLMDGSGILLPDELYALSIKYSLYKYYDGKVYPERKYMVTDTWGSIWPDILIGGT